MRGENQNCVNAVSPPILSRSFTSGLSLCNALKEKEEKEEKEEVVSHFYNSIFIFRRGDARSKSKKHKGTAPKNKLQI